MLKNFNLAPTVLTKVNTIDNMIGGGFVPALHTVEGISGTGKTAMLLQIANESQFPVFFLNCEMSERELGKRLIARTTKVDINNLTGLPQAELDSLVALTEESNKHIQFEDGKTGYVSFDYIKDAVANIANTYNSDNIVVIIDSFNEWVNTAKPNNRKSFVDETITKLLDLITEFGVTIITSAQTKEGEEETNSALEFASDTYLILKWEKSGRTDSNGHKISNVFAKKNRNGTANISKLVKFKSVIQNYEA